MKLSINLGMVFLFVGLVLVTAVSHVHAVGEGPGRISSFDITRTGELNNGGYGYELNWSGTDVGDYRLLITCPEDVSVLIAGQERCGSIVRFEKDTSSQMTIINRAVSNSTVVFKMRAYTIYDTYDDNRDLEVTVPSEHKPAILSGLEVDRQAIDSGETISVTWSGVDVGEYEFYVNCVDGITATWDGRDICNKDTPVGQNTSLALKLENTNSSSRLVTFTLEALAEGASGYRMSLSQGVHVAPANSDAKIQAFTLSRSNVHSGGDIVVAWEAERAEKYRLAVSCTSGNVSVVSKSFSRDELCNSSKDYSKDGSDTLIVRNTGKSQSNVTFTLLVYTDGDLHDDRLERRLQVLSHTAPTQAKSEADADSTHDSEEKNDTSKEEDAEVAQELDGYEFRISDAESRDEEARINDVRTIADLEAYTISLVGSMDAIKEVEIKENAVEVHSTHDGRLFGFVPVSIERTTTIRIVDGEENSLKPDVTIKQSWWAFLSDARKEAEGLRESLIIDIRDSIDERRVVDPGVHADVLEIVSAGEKS